MRWMHKEAHLGATGRTLSADLKGARIQRRLDWFRLGLKQPCCDKSKQLPSCHLIGNELKMTRTKRPRASGHLWLWHEKMKQEADAWVVESPQVVNHDHLYWAEARRAIVFRIPLRRYQIFSQTKSISWARVWETGRPPLPKSERNEDGRTRRRDPKRHKKKNGDHSRGRFDASSVMTEQEDFYFSRWYGDICHLCPRCAGEPVLTFECGPKSMHPLNRYCTRVKIRDRFPYLDSNMDSFDVLLDSKLQKVKYLTAFWIWIRKGGGLDCSFELQRCLLY